MVIYVTKEALNNIFIYLTPNIEVLGNNTSTAYYFEISTTNNEQLENLKNRFKQRGVSTVNIQEIYDKQDKETLNSYLQIIYICLSGMLLLYIIYYFLEMSDSTKNSKEYGIYRAIGVNKSNLLFKETIRTIYKNISVLLLVLTIGTILCSIYYFVSNISYGVFILINLGLFITGGILMILVSLIPYLFVINKTPSEIIARYDI